MPIDRVKKSSRLLASRRYTHETFNDSQEAFTRVLDLNSSEVYTQEDKIPSSSLPYSGSSQNEQFFTVDGNNILKYYYRFRLTRSNQSVGGNEVWFFISKSGHDYSPVDAQSIIEGQQVNFISPKYSIASLGGNYADGSPPGYNIRITVDGVDQNPNDYAFDYKTGVLQFSASIPSLTALVSASVYQYVGKTLNTTLTELSASAGGGTGAGFPFSGSAVITGSLTVSGSGGITLVGGGTLIGTASYATTALFAPDYVPTSVTSSMLAPYVLNSQTSSFLLATQTSSLASLGVTGNATISGDLTVNGTTTYVNVNNLLVEDKFILLNSGSTGGVPNEGGIIIQTGTGSGGEAVGTALYYDQEANRWVVNRSSSVAWNATSSVLSTSSDFIVTVTASSGVPTGTPVNFGTGSTNFSVGQMYIMTDGDNGIYIYA